MHEYEKGYHNDVDNNNKQVTRTHNSINVTVLLIIKQAEQIINPSETNALRVNHKKNKLLRLITR